MPNPGARSKLPRALRGRRGSDGGGGRAPPPGLPTESEGIPFQERAEAADLDSKQILIIGCGNVLMYDDGLGPAVIQRLARTVAFPPRVGLIDAGTGVRKILFNIVLAPPRPEKIILIDAVDVGRKPGEVFEISLDDIPGKKSDDFSMHQLPTSNLLKELRDACGVAVCVLAAQVESIPEEIRGGLSGPVAAAIPELCALASAQAGLIPGRMTAPASPAMTTPSL